MMNGRGRLTMPNGNIYEGLFKDDNLNGTVLLTRPDQTICVAYFENGKPVKKGN